MDEGPRGARTVECRITDKLLTALGTSRSGRSRFWIDCLGASVSIFMNFQTDP